MLFYAKTFDPIFLNLPLWLRIVCSLDTILFGPFYAVSVYAFWTKQREARYGLIALPVSGALLYSTVVCAYGSSRRRAARRSSGSSSSTFRGRWSDPAVRAPRAVPAIVPVDREDAPFTAYVTSYFGAEIGQVRAPSTIEQHGRQVVYGHSDDVCEGSGTRPAAWYELKCYGFGEEDRRRWQQQAARFGRMEYPYDDGHIYSGVVEGRYAGEAQ